MTGKKDGASSRARVGDGKPEQGFDRWLNRQLHRLYDPVLAEPVPDEIVRLLHQFDDRAPPLGTPADPSGKRSKDEGN